MKEIQSACQLPVIAGSGRSGTTWLLDVLADANGLRPVFEPLFPGASHVAQKYQCTYLERSAEAPDLVQYLRNIIEHQETNSFVQYRISPAKLRISLEHLKSPRAIRSYLSTLNRLRRRRSQFAEAMGREPVIVKFIRANWLLPWLEHNFSAKSVLVVRHPGAVVESQLRFIEHWLPDARLNRYLASGAIRQSYRSKIDVLESRTLSVFSKLLAIWCIENVEPIRKSSSNGYDVMFYEDLKNDYPSKWSNLARCLGLKNIPGRTAVVRPSQQSSSQWKTKNTAEGEAEVGTWRDRLGDEYQAEFDFMLDLFGVDFYKWESDQPLVDDILDWNGAKAEHGRG